MTQRIGDYEVGAPLGRGGMATVYRARHVPTGALRALKLVEFRGKGSAERHERFAREARALAKVDRHPHVVRVHEHGRLGPSQAYCVLEWVDGEDLEARLRRGPLPLEELVRVLAPVAEALAHCHAEGIVHRDLKPANVLIRRDGHAFLTDFGVARDAEEERLTATNAVLGTACYMSPEQCRGDSAAIGPASDVFAFGVLVLEASFGHYPFEHSEVFQLLARHGRGSLQEDPDARASLPRDLSRLIDRCLETQPRRRPSAALCAAALRACAAGRPSPLPAPPRRRVGLGVAGAVVVSVGVWLGWRGEVDGWEEPRWLGAVEVERGWLEAKLRGEPVEVSETRAAVRALTGDDRAPREALAARLRASAELPASARQLQARLLLRLCVADGAPWPEDVGSEHASSQVSALRAVAEGLGWLGSAPDPERVTAGLSELSEGAGALREALAELDQRVEEARAVWVEGVVGMDPGLAPLTVEGVPEGLRAYGEARCAAAMREGLAEALPRLAAQWAAEPLLEEDLRFERLVGSLPGSRLASLEGPGLREVVTAFVAAVTRDLEARGVEGASLVSALRWLSSWREQVAWSRSPAEECARELIYRGFGDYQLLTRLFDPEVLLLHLWVSWVLPTNNLELLRLQWSEGRYADHTRTQASSEWSLILGAFELRVRPGGFRPRAVGHLADALGAGLPRAQRERLGLSGPPGWSKGLSARWALRAKQLLGATLLRMRSAEEGVHEAALELLQEVAVEGRAVIPRPVWYSWHADALGGLADRCKDGHALGSELSGWVERESRALVGEVFEVFDTLSLEGEPVPRLLALSRGAYSVEELRSDLRQGSHAWISLLEAAGRGPEMLEAIRWIQARRAELLLPCDHQLQLRLLERCWANDDYQGCLEASQALLVPGGLLMEDIQMGWDRAVERARWYRAGSFLRLEQWERAWAELDQVRDRSGREWSELVRELERAAPR